MLSVNQSATSDWLVVDQQRIHQFAGCTDDRQWIHVDVDRARRESPFGAPIAHGYLLLALLPRFLHEVGALTADSQCLNYGVERVRFLSPVRVGSRVRCRVELLEAQDRGRRAIVP